MKLFKAVTAALVLCLGAAGAASAQQPQENVIEGLIYRPMPVAIPSFAGDTPEARDIANKISEVIRSDLESSALFRLIDQAAFIQKDVSIDVYPRWPDWATIQAQGLVVGQISIDGSKNMVAQVRVYDVFRNVELHAESFKASSPDSWRRIAHMAADAVYEALTLEKGYFDSRIAFVSENTSVSPHRRRLAIMDQDGATAEHLVSGGDLVQTARFSPTEMKLIYTAVVNDERNPLIKRTRIFLYDVVTGRRELLSESTDSDQKFAARFAPDGRSVVFSRSIDGNTDLYQMDFVRRGQPARRLTNDRNIDTEPSFSPDGQRVVFTSDRSGSPQLYIMRLDGQPVSCNGTQAKECRITNSGSGRYQTPVWSPRGDWIAFARSQSDRWSIGVIKTDGTGERLLTESFLDEAPTWSPNGRVIAFARTAGPGAGSKIWTIDFSGRNLRQLRTPNDASDPAWSPLLSGQ